MSEQNFNISTYTRVFLSEWQAFKAFLQRYGRSIKRQYEAANEPDERVQSDILTEEEIHSAFNGPLQIIFRLLAKELAVFLRVKVEFKFRNDDIFIKHKVKYDDVLANEEMVNLNEGSLTGLQKRLNDLVSEIDEQWQELVEEAQTVLLQTIIEDQAVQLSETEIREFKDIETERDLEHRFIDLALTFPKTAKKQSLSLRQYFLLKTSAAIQSSINRQHLPLEKADVEKKIKNMQAVFNQIAETEQQLFQQHQQQLAQALSPLDFARENLQNIGS